jgi:ligand-binding sensor domain-containing protein/serine phosphatase RsbU (regulator of sigma subunit)
MHLYHYPSRQRTFFLVLFLFFILGAGTGARAHNGSVALAVPVGEIAIDGDFSDWPAGIRRYSIARFGYGDRPEDGNDLKGWFSLGYDNHENALYLAVEVEDDAILVGAEEEAQDGCEVYLDLLHGDRDSPAVMYAAYGEVREVRDQRGRLQPWEGVELEQTREENTLRYEWRIEVGDSTPGLGGARKTLHEGMLSRKGDVHSVRLNPRKSLGLDVAIRDQDSPVSKTWFSWGKGTRKRKVPERRGDAILLPEGGGTGVLQGHLNLEEWEGRRNLFAVRSLASEVLWLRPEIAPEGGFSVEIPVGGYAVEVGGETVDVEVLRDGVVDLALILPQRGREDQEEGGGRSVKAGTGLRQGEWRTLGIPDGLPSLSVRDIVQDRNDHLWFATGGGVVQFDGSRFTTFTTADGLAHDEVFDIHQDGDGKLWFATRGGVSRFDGERFASFSEADGLNANEVWTFFEDGKGNLLLGTTAGVDQFNRDMFTRFKREDGLVEGNIYDIFQDRDGSIWLATEEGASRFDGESWTALTDEEDFPPQRVFSVYQDRVGAIWFGLDEMAVRYDGRDLTALSRGDSLFGEIDHLWEIYEDREGALWFASEGGQVKYAGGELAHFPYDGDLVVNNWWSYLEAERYEDGKGNSWFNTLEGAVRFDGREYASLEDVTGFSGTSEDLPIFADRDGMLWFGTTEGVVRWDGEKGERFTTADGLSGNKVDHIYQDRSGDMWIGSTWGGVSRFDGKGFTVFDKQNGLPSNSIMAVYEDRRGDIWISTGRGLSRYREGQFTTFTIRDGLASNSPQTIREDREGNLWFGRTFFNGKLFRKYGAEQGFPDEYCDLIFQESEGYLWFFEWKNDELYRYNGAQFVDFLPTSGLEDVGVNAMFEEDGGTLWLGTDRGVCRSGDGELTCLDEEDGLPGKRVLALNQDERGRIWIGTDEGLAFYEDGVISPALGTLGKKIQVLSAGGGGEMWIGTNEGLYLFGKQGATDVIRRIDTEGGDFRAIYQDREGNLWFGTEENGISRFDGGQFAVLAADGDDRGELLRGLVDSWGALWFAATEGDVLRYEGTRLVEVGIEGEVLCMLEDDGGTIWLGTREGVFRLAGNDVRQWGEKDGLGHYEVRGIFQDRDGGMWFATPGGVSRYDGGQLDQLTALDGLVDDGVRVIFQDRDGGMWFGTDEGGVSRYDGGDFENYQLHFYTVAQGTVHGGIRSISQDSRGNVWIATDGGGVGRYDGTGLVMFTTADGLGHDAVVDVQEDAQGRVWIATDGGGVSRYDSTGLVTFTTADGLAHDEVTCIARDEADRLWFGTRGGGVSQYDGLVFQNLLGRDGLSHNVVNAILPDGNGNIWFATRMGITRYRPQQTTPGIAVIDVNRRGAATSISMSWGGERLSIGLKGVSFKTRPEQMAYVYRLEGLEEDWKYQYDGQIEYADLSVGEYVFRAKAVDRDLNYSEEVQVRVEVRYPFVQIAMVGGLGFALFGLGLVSVYAVRRRRDLQRAQQALIGELEKELQTAHEMQMALMPTEKPRIKGVDIAGRCQPATQVGGDFFQYFGSEGNRLSIILADVTGHAMEAAVPVMMFSGILKTEMQYGHSIENLYASLNRTLHEMLENRTFICLAMGEIDPATGNLRMANSGCPYPFHYRAATGDVVELQLDAYPLGINPTSDYPVVEVRLESGDRVVFCSDGIIEAANEIDEQFDFDRTAETIRRGCAQNLSSEGLIEMIFAEVESFAGETPQGDDQTIVVLGMDG